MLDETMIKMLLEGIRDTCYMTIVSTFCGYLIGLPLGIALTLTDENGITPNRTIYRILDVIINITRSIPFLILLILVMPLTKAIVGKTYGSTATIVPLTLAAAPFIGRMVESSLKEVPAGVIEAALSMGAKTGTIVFQSYELFPHKTILENILLAPMKVQKRPRSQVEAEALELLQKVGLADRRDDYPRQLSGGQKQRVAIVRALCMHPEILLLDEITAALDPEMVREVLDVVLSLAKAGSTMVIVTHEMNFARAIADRILFLENGEIVEESGDPKAFFASPATARAKAFLRSFDYE